MLFLLEFNRYRYKKYIFKQKYKIYERKKIKINIYKIYLDNIYINNIYILIRYKLIKYILII